jgi:hypothetical protein
LSWVKKSQGNNHHVKLKMWVYFLCSTKWTWKTVLPYIVIVMHPIAVWRNIRNQQLNMPHYCSKILSIAPFAKCLNLSPDTFTFEINHNSIICLYVNKKKKKNYLPHFHISWKNEIYTYNFGCRLPMKSSIYGFMCVFSLRERFMKKVAKIFMSALGGT